MNINLALAQNSLTNCDDCGWPETGNYVVGGRVRCLVSSSPGWSVAETRHRSFVDPYRVRHNLRSMKVLKGLEFWGLFFSVCKSQFHFDYEHLYTLFWISVCLYCVSELMLGSTMFLNIRGLIMLLIKRLPLLWFWIYVRLYYVFNKRLPLLCFQINVLNKYLPLFCFWTTVYTHTITTGK